MSEFDANIRIVQRSYLMLYVVAGCFILLVGLVMYIWIFSVRGFEIKILPDAASMTSNLEVVTGIGMAVDDRLYILGDRAIVRAWAKNYEPEDISITASSPNLLSVKLSPSPGRLVLKAADTADKAAWFINDEFIGLGEDIEYSLLPGNHKIRVDSPYHHPLSQVLAVESNQQIFWEAPLERVRVELHVETTPMGAEVILDGQSLGKTPLFITKKGGEYSLNLSLRGYEPLNDTLVLNNKRGRESRNYNLISLEASLSINLSPPGGVLLVNGIQVSNLEKVAVDSGKRNQISYSKLGYHEFNRELTLKPNEHRSLDIKLSANMGKVVVKSTVPARLSINGRVVGNTPYETELSSRAYKVVLTRNGYRTVERKIQPSDEAPILLDIEMLTEYEARRREGKPIIAQQMGIDLLSFRPKQFTMGSKPNERGRRRNEFRKKVRFSRSILVSKHEITESQFSDFIGRSSTSSLPISNVSWWEAIAFCNWLSDKEGLPLFYLIQDKNLIGLNPEASGYRLPTEAEWEWLAKKGAHRRTESIYVWGNDESGIIGNIADESLKGVQTFYIKGYNDAYPSKASVGSFKAERSGLHDMGGNVSEWVHDWYSNVPPNSDQVYEDPLGPRQGGSGPGQRNAHVVKGGNYLSGQMNELRSAYRRPGDQADPTVGFRIVRYQ